MIFPRHVQSSDGSLVPLGSCVDATMRRIDGGYSSAAERLTVAQDVVGSIPTSRPISPLWFFGGTHVFLLSFPL
uniref:Uncharacterized protein n=1 Tax=mine drainage metagenome TaxID=410659 RepID=E6QM75_9ZZZZ